MDRSETKYSRVISSANDRKNFWNTVVNAEGGGWGVKVSVGVDVIKGSQQSENSVSLAVGSSKTVNKQFIRNPEALKLKKSALDLLKSNPKLFLDIHGRYYIYQIRYGGQFMGMIDVYGKTSESKDGLKVFAGLDINAVAFKASVSA